MNARKKTVFTILTFCLLGGIGLFATEVFVRVKTSVISSQQMAPGLMRYHARMGWLLTPQWHGRHKHFDYDVVYSTNFYGFRGYIAEPDSNQKPVGIFVGDSFTFGLGVNDSDTFVRLLNELDTSNVYLNLAVPGYSTDQEVLLLTEKAFYFSPDIVYLVVYLGNDLLDNKLAFPLQADRGKPYFEITRDSKELHLRNIPVPLFTKSEAQNQADISELLNSHGIGIGNSFLRRFKSFSLLAGLMPHHEVSFEGKFDDELSLFKALILKAKQICEDKGTGLKVILLPGSSYVEEPLSVSAALQDYFRKSIMDMQTQLGIGIVDIAAKLREQYSPNNVNWFYPNDGHLTPAGNRVVADLLFSQLKF